MTIKNKISFMDLRITDNSEREMLISSFKRLMNHGQFIMGSEVDNFEREIARHSKRRYCIGISSGTDAIYIALKGLGIGIGDEVITTSLSWIATANAISMTGATPVFCDIEDDLNISIKSIERMITAKTKAILPVHYTGLPCNIKGIDKISKKNGIPVVYDAAQAFGSEYNNNPIGMYGVASCFSMNPMKTLGALGEAGAVVTDDRNLYEEIKMLRYNGTVNKEVCISKGLNARIDSLQAAILLDRLKLVDSIVERRISIATKYNDYFKGYSLKIPQYNSNLMKSSYYSYTIQVNDRNGMIKYLSDFGVETKIQHPILMSAQKPYINNKSDELKTAKRAVEKILSIPANEKITDIQVKKISDLIIKYLNKSRL